MNAQRGDVVLVMFPDSNLRTAKRRPALVVQSDQLQAGLPQTIVAMITSNMARAGHPSRQPVSAKSPAGQQMGLPNLFRNVFCIQALAKSITFAFNCRDFDSEEVKGGGKENGMSPKI